MTDTASGDSMTGEQRAECAELIDAARQLLISIDDGPSGVAGLDSGKNICLKGSFLSFAERLRYAITKAEGK
jgi:hypothetical protein